MCVMYVLYYDMYSVSVLKQVYSWTLSGLFSISRQAYFCPDMFVVKMCTLYVKAFYADQMSA